MAAPMICRGLRLVRMVCVPELERLRQTRPLLQPCRAIATSSCVRSKVKRKSGTKKVEKPVHQYLGETPTQSIYLMEDYPPQPFSLSQCIKMHQEAAHPDIANTLHAQIYADLTLDMTTKKKTKFLKDVRGLLTFPHQFPHNQKKNYIVFSENPADVAYASEIGADYAGGENIIEFVKSGLISKADLRKADFVVATTSMAIKLLGFRGVLMDKMPSVHNGYATNNVVDVLKKHEDGVLYRSTKDADAEGVGRMQVPFGQLEQTTEQLIENFQYMLDTLYPLKAKGLAPLISKVKLVAPPSAEMFLVQKDDFALRQPPTNTIQDDEDDDEEED